MKSSRALYTLIAALIVTAFLVFMNSNLVCSANFDSARRSMVETQIRDRGVSDPRVLAAMGAVARHGFVPAHMKPLAYSDGPLPIGEGQTISQPFIVALMTELLVTGTSGCTEETMIFGGAPAPEGAREKNAQAEGTAKSGRYLEIGTGSGYQAAVLAELAYEVYTIEIVESLGKRAEETLKDLGYKNIFTKIGDGYKGWPDKAPFDGIIVTCAPDDIPRPLLDQMSKDGGRMVIPVGPEGQTQQLLLVTRNGDAYSRRYITAVAFVPMTGEAKGRTK